MNPYSILSLFKFQHCLKPLPQNTPGGHSPKKGEVWAIGYIAALHYTTVNKAHAAFLPPLIPFPDYILYSLLQYPALPRKGTNTSICNTLEKF